MSDLFDLDLDLVSDLFNIDLDSFGFNIPEPFKNIYFTASILPPREIGQDKEECDYDASNANATSLDDVD